MFMITFGCAWGTALLLFGLWLWLWQRGAPYIMPGSHAMPGAGLSDTPGKQAAQGVALATIASAQFVFMALVADTVCPQAAPGLRHRMQACAGWVMALALAWAVWRLWPVIAPLVG